MVQCLAVKDWVHFLVKGVQWYCKMWCSKSKEISYVNANRQLIGTDTFRTKKDEVHCSFLDWLKMGMTQIWDEILRIQIMQYVYHPVHPISKSEKSLEYPLEKSYSFYNPKYPPFWCITFSSSITFDWTAILKLSLMIISTATLRCSIFPSSSNRNKWALSPP